MLELNHKRELLQCQLEEALATVKAKESKVLELEDIMKRKQSPRKEASSTYVPIQDEVTDLEIELERLLEKKFQAEVELLIILKTTHNWKIMAEGQISLLEEQKSLSRDQTKVMLKLSDTENRLTRLKDKADELEARCKELLETENVLKLQNKVCKISVCCFIQLLLLCFAFGLFLVQLMPPADECVPT